MSPPSGYSVLACWWAGNCAAEHPLRKTPERLYFEGISLQTCDLQCIHLAALRFS